jgi:hypothetical protein
MVLARVASFDQAEQPFRILLGFPGNVALGCNVNPHSMEEHNMKKFGYVLATLGVIAIAAPSIASAKTVVIKRGAHQHHLLGARAEFREHRDFGMHRGWRHHHADKVMIVKKRHHEY